MIEGADPDMSEGPQGPIGVIAEGENFVTTKAGRQAVRGGSAVKQTFNESGAEAALTRMLQITPFAPTGAVAIGHYATTPKTFAYRLTSAMAFFTGSQSTSRHDLSWNIASPPRPVCAELFEKLYLADASAFADRQALTSLDASGTVTATSYDLDGIVGSPATGTIKAYTLAAFNGVLFVAGYDSETNGDAPEFVRHSFLSKNPDAADGFDKDAYNRIGAVGIPVTAMAPGKTELLLAKPNELYRITGSGRALPGWQYITQQVDNTKGYGVSNALAFCHAEGFWYGVGEGGPFITDGRSVESLAGLRAFSWAKNTNLNNCWVAHHPERGCMLFGFNASPVDAGRSSTYPWVIWPWDIDRQQWMTNWKFSADIMVASAIPGGAVSAPSAAPSNLSIDHPNATTTSVEADWTNGDASAQTELWVRPDGGSSALHATAGAGAITATLSSLTAGTKYFVKIRHKKGAVVSDFTAEVEAYTRLAAPTLVLVEAFNDSTILVDYIVPQAGSDLKIEKNDVVVKTVTSAPSGAGATSVTSGCGSTSDWTAFMRRSTWPASIQDSADSNEISYNHQCGGPL